MTPLEILFSPSDVGNKKDIEVDDSKIKNGYIFLLNIGTQYNLKTLKIGAQCSEEEKHKLVELFCEFKDVFAWPYEDLHGFYPNVIQHDIPIKEEVKPVRKRQIPIKPTLEATIRKEVEKLINAHIIFSIKYYEWVSNFVLVWKQNGDIKLCVDSYALNKKSVKDNFPLPNMELILQQVARSQIMSLIDGFSSYNQIKVKREVKYKTTFTTR